MDKLFFAIYKTQNKELQHTIVYRSTKKVLQDELRDQGHIPKAVFGQLDADKIMREEFYNAAIRDIDINYFKEHFDEWEKAKK